jgi:hypothetical protein
MMGGKRFFFQLFFFFFFFLCSPRTYIHDSFGNEFEELQYTSLWEMKLVVFVRSGLNVNFLETDVVPCGGPGQNLGNKGAVGVSFWIGSTSFCFIGAHLAAHEGEAKTKLRNANYQKIVQDLQLGMRNFPLMTQFDHIIFCGDLNYRLREFNEGCQGALKSGDIQHLRQYDELAKEIEEMRTLPGFSEGDITFRPTFKLYFASQGSDAAGADLLAVSDTLSYNMLRIPSYCDRVLWRSNVASRPLRCIEYGASFETAIAHGGSDHAPVWGVYSCPSTVEQQSLTMEDQTPTCFLMLTALSVKLKGNWPPTPDVLASPLFLQSAVMTVQSPCLCNASAESLVPVKHWNTKADPTFLGACAVTCRPGLTLERISKDKLFCTVSMKSEGAPQTSILGCGVLRLSRALVNAASKPVPFEMELYTRGNSELVGLCVGSITCTAVQ